MAKVTDPERLLGFNDSKYTVKRTDGSSRKGKKHERCRYYVLDLEHDKFAWPALKAYEKACRKLYPDLAADLRRLLSSGFGESVGR